MHKENNENELKLEKEALEVAIKNRWEGRDLDFGQVGQGITWFFVFKLALFPIAFLCLFVILKFIGVDRPTVFPGIIGPLVETTKNAPKLAPLQNNVTTWKDMQDLRIREQKEATTYGTTDRGTVRIPIDKAMERVAKKGSSGLSVKPETPASTSPTAPANP